MKKLVFFTFFLLNISIIFAQKTPTYQPKAGDFLLQDLDCGGLCDAIEKVTPGLGGKHFSHIGLVCKINDSLYVVEAIGVDVHLTKVENFISRNKTAEGKPKIVVMRLKDENAVFFQKATLFCLEKLGTPYDDTFIYDNGKYYCSELLYDAFKYANNNKPFFEMQPMTYCDPQTKQTFPAWTEYYKSLQFEIPEGKLGCNPGSIANSPKLKFIQELY